MSTNGAAVQATQPPELPPVVPTPAMARLDPAAYVEDAPPFSAAVLEVLAAEPDHDDVEERDAGNGRSLLYVPWVHYQRVLMKAFGPGGFRIVPTAVARVEGAVMTYKGALFVRAPGQAKFQFVDEAKGECGMRGGMSTANAEEGAKSDCLVKCCKRLAIFDCLWDPNWRRAWEKHHAGKKHAQVKSAPWPSAAPVSPSEPSSPAATAAPSGGTTAPAAPAAGDTGEPANDEQKEALKGQVRRLQLTAGYLKLWMRDVFGLTITDAKRAFEALSRAQADNAYLLLNVHGKPLYEKLLADLREKGDLPS